MTVTATVTDALDPSETIDPVNGGTVTFHIAGAYTITASYTPPDNP